MVEAKFLLAKRRAFRAKPQQPLPCSRRSAIAAFDALSQQAEQNHRELEGAKRLAVGDQSQRRTAPVSMP